MRCIVTAGPSIEALDQVRRLTNFSTGQLGCELANFLTQAGHEVTLLLGQQANWQGERKVAREERFSSGADLSRRLQELSKRSVEAVFHAAAVGDFSFGKVWSRGGDGSLKEVEAGKLSTRDGVLIAELVPTPKIIAGLRGMFPDAVIVGWKYEVDGGQEGALRAAAEQIAAYDTDACVANGPAYGEGFGLLRRSGERQHFEDRTALFSVLNEMLGANSRKRANGAI